MNPIPASVFILTKNSGKTLRRALESVKDFDDIVICDGGSTDETLAIAKEFGARIFPQDPACLDTQGGIVDYACTRNACFARTRYDWVVYIDSDEEMTPGLKEEIRRIAEDQKPVRLFWKIPCRVVVGEREILYSSNYPGYQVRFFNKKSGARFRKAVHERLDFDANIFSPGTFMHPWRYFIPEKGQGLFADFPHYLSIELARARDLPFSRRIRNVAHAYLTAAKIAVKASRNYLLHGFRHSMPMRHEYSRIRYQLLLARTILFQRVPKI